VNINVTENDDVKNFKADIVSPSVERSAIIGNISVAIMDLEGFRVGDGELTMNDGGDSVTYRVLLQVF
jgi:hypothetical protein